MYVYYGVLLLRGTAAWQVLLYQFLLLNGPHVVPTWHPTCGALARLGPSWGVRVRLGCALARLNAPWAVFGGWRGPS